MELLYQQDPALPAPFAKDGCHFMAHCAMPQLWTGKTLGAEDLVRVASECQEYGLVDGELSLPEQASPYYVIKHAALALGKPKLRGNKVGSIEGGNVRFWDPLLGLRLRGAKCYFDFALQVGPGPRGEPHSILYDATLREVYNPSNRPRSWTPLLWILYRMFSVA